MIQHHAEEFTLNFVYVFPNATQGKLLSSMIVSPGHAKRIWRALDENISRFEALYGPSRKVPKARPAPTSDSFSKTEISVRFCAASDQSVLVYLGEEISLAVHGRVEKLLRVLQKNPPHWLRNIQPAYASLMVTFDPCRADHSKVEAALKKFEARAQKSRSPKTHLIEIPVCYGGAFGPDLEKLPNCTPQEVASHRASHSAYFITPISWDFRRALLIWRSSGSNSNSPPGISAKEKYPRAAWESLASKQVYILLPHQVDGG